MDNRDTSAGSVAHNPGGAKLPAVSVVIPTFNRERWLPRSVGSVQAQSLRDWELLVVDDGSTDGSAELLEAMAAEDPRIRPMKNLRTKGVSGARNTGIDAARGEYIAFLDSDDEWLPGHLEAAVSYLERYPEQIDLVTGCVEHRHFDSGELYGQVKFDLAKYDCEPLEGAWLFATETLFDHALFQRPVMVTQAIVVRRRFLQELRFPEDLRVGEDHYFHLLLASRGIKIAHFQQSHVVYWAHGGNTTTAGGSEQDPLKTISLHEGFAEEHRKILDELPLTTAQRRRVTRIMAQECFWQIGYRGYLHQRQYVEARRAFRTALYWDRWNATFWRTYLLSFVRQALHL